jgi:exonuclease SbcD
VAYRFIHSADLHLNSPFKRVREVGEANLAVADILQNSTFNAYDNLIQLCIDREVNALLVAGDVFDSADRSLKAQIRFVKGLERLREANIQAFICHGNHDPLNGWGAELQMPKNVVQFKKDAKAVPFDPEDRSSPVVCGISYPTREVKDSLLHKFPEPEHNRFTIGLLHANVGARTEHAAYAPCSVEDLVQTGYSYWALGHVHTRGILHENPHVVYSGNTQGRQPNEVGPRGVYVVDVDERDEVKMEFVPVDVVRWQPVDVQIDGIEDDNELFTQIVSLVKNLTQADERNLVYRLHLLGRGRMYQAMAQPDYNENLRKQLNNETLSSRPFALCGGILNQTRSELDRNDMRKGKDFIGDFLRLTEQALQDEDLLAELHKELEPLYGNQRVRQFKKDLSPLTTDDLRTLLGEVEDIALDLLVGDEVEE